MCVFLSLANILTVLYVIGYELSAFLFPILDSEFGVGLKHQAGNYEF